MGSGLSSLTLYSSVGKVFKKKRAFANSILSSAGVITAFFLGPLTQKLVVILGWRGGTLILGGVVLNAIPTVLVASWFYLENAVIIKGKRESQYKLYHLFNC